MSYKAIYRAYRPRFFSDVAGQKHIVRTFQNALKDNKISHAYLFSGPRGTGKTSIAKIIANAVNCEQFPVSEPCGSCSHCLAVQKGVFPDIIEIDAASNNGVDEIREIRDKVKYTPSQGKYKVYIIDEVHMLSIGAFNALLKTLEEPPQHVIFILATTEPHKVPATIQSRCQRFDFKEISVKDIKRKLNRIVEQEHLAVTLEAMDAIAEAAEGGLRDAESLLDQAISYSDERVTDQDVHAVAGTVSDYKIIEVFKALRAHNVVDAIHILNELIENGKEVNRITSQMITFLKDVLMYKHVKQDNNKIIFSKPQFQELSDALHNDLVFYYVECLTEAQREMKFVNNPRTYIEITFMKMADSKQQQESELIKRVEALESKLSEGVTVKAEKKPAPKPEPKIEPKPLQVETQNKAEEPEELFTEVFEETHQQTEQVKIYDVTRITNILNDAMRNKAESKDIKLKVLGGWNEIPRKSDASLFVISQNFAKGSVEAVWDSEMIVTYPSVEMVNKLNRKDVKRKIRSLLRAVYEQDFDYIALPTELWDQKRNEFIEQFQVGNNPILTELEYPGLSMYEEVHAEPEVVTDAIKLFGESIVNVK